MITLTQMEYCCTVADLRNFSRAAKRCRVSQPSLSLQVQKAESLLGVPLFDRHQTPVRVTHEGKKLILQMRKILNERNLLLTLSDRTLTEIDPLIRISAIPTVSPYVLPQLYIQLRNKYPQLELSFSELTTANALEALESDTIDLALIATQEDSKRFIQTEIVHEEMVLYTSPNHPLLEKKKISVYDLDATELWLLEEGHCLRDEVIQFCKFKEKQLNRSHSMDFKVGNLESLRALVRSGKGYTLIPEFSVPLLSEPERRCIRPFEANKRPTRTLYLTRSIYSPEKYTEKVIFSALQSLLPSRTR